MERSTREHQDTRQYHPELFAWLLRTRPIGKLINHGHLHLGYTVIEYSKVDVESDIETCGDGLRVFIAEGNCLRYTTRLTQIGQVWYVADLHTTLNLNNKKIKLRDMAFSTPQDFARFFYEAVYQTARRIQLTAVQA